MYQGGPLLIVVPLWPVDGEIIRRIPLQFNPCTVGVPSSSFRNPNASCLLVLIQLISELITRYLHHKKDAFAMAYLIYQLV